MQNNGYSNGNQWGKKKWGNKWGNKKWGDKHKEGGPSSYGRKLLTRCRNTPPCACCSCSCCSITRQLLRWSAVLPTSSPIVQYTCAMTSSVTHVI